MIVVQLGKTKWIMILPFSKRYSPIGSFHFVMNSFPLTRYTQKSFIIISYYAYSLITLIHFIENKLCNTCFCLHSYLHSLFRALPRIILYYSLNNGLQNSQHIKRILNSLNESNMWVYKPRLSNKTIAKISLLLNKSSRTVVQ